MKNTEHVKSVFIAMEVSQDVMAHTGELNKKSIAFLAVLCRALIDKDGPGRELVNELLGEYGGISVSDVMNEVVAEVINTSEDLGIGQQGTDRDAEFNARKAVVKQMLKFKERNGGWE